MTKKRPSDTPSRRSILKGLAAGSAVAATATSLLSAPAIGQGLTKIKMTLPWLAQGAQLYPFIARNKGFWKARGLDVEIARGYGSGAAIQAVAQGQFEVGLVALPTVILSAAKGLDMRSLGIAGYDATLGLLTLDDSPIKTPKDLEGRKLGSTPTSSEVPYVDPFLERSGVDVAKVQRVQLAANVLETALIQRQVDATSAFATSNLPNFLAQNIKFRFLPFAPTGLVLYANTFLVTPETYATKKSVCEAWVDGMNEAVKYCMTNFDDSVDIFLKEVPEVRMSSTGKQFTQYGAGLFLATQMVKEAQQGVGYGDMASLDTQIDLVMKYVAGPDAKRPVTEKLFTNEFAGKIKLSAAEWDAAKKSAAPYAAYLGMSV